MTDATQKKFRKLVRQLGRLIQAEAERGLAAPKAEGKAKPQADAPRWESAFVDVRWFADAEGWSAKFRVVLPDGTFSSLRTSNDMEDLILEISSVRKEEMPAEWYGLKVIVNYDGAVTTELNNDPNCIVDPAWFKS